MGIELEIAGSGWELLAVRMAGLKEQGHAVMHSSQLARRESLYVWCLHFSNQKLAQSDEYEYAYGYNGTNWNQGCPRKSWIYGYSLEMVYF